MYFLFAFDDCENDWNTGGMDNYKGCFETLEEAKQQFVKSNDTFGQIACQSELGAQLVVLCRYERSGSSNPLLNCWLSESDEHWR